MQIRERSICDMCYLREIETLKLGTFSVVSAMEEGDFGNTVCGQSAVIELAADMAKHTQK